jgi:hypothetical protein
VNKFVEVFSSFCLLLFLFSLFLFFCSLLACFSFQRTCNDWDNGFCCQLSFHFIQISLTSVATACCCSFLDCFANEMKTFQFLEWKFSIFEFKQHLRLFQFIIVHWCQTKVAHSSNSNNNMLPIILNSIMNNFYYFSFSLNSILIATWKILNRIICLRQGGIDD